MLDCNLATRPFYNERAVHLVIGIVVLLAGGAIGVGLWQAAELSRERGRLAAAAERDEGEARSAAGETAKIRRTLAGVELDRLAAATAEANRLIERRAFSWTEFFNRIEQTLPAGVMLTSVQPDVADGAVTVTLGVIGRSVAEIDAFIDRLETTGVFTGMLPRDEAATDAGAYRTLLVGRYAPAPSPAPEADR